MTTTRKEIAKLAARRVLQRVSRSSSAKAPKQYAQQPNLDQEEFDRLRALMSREQLQAAAKGLAALARRKAIDNEMAEALGYAPVWDLGR